MARRISTGVVGKNVLGALSTENNQISSVVTDQDIILSPDGTGEVQSESDFHLLDENVLKLGDAQTAPNTGYVGIKAPSNVSASGNNYTLTMPVDAGTNGYVLTTNGSGTLTWENVAVQVGDDIAAIPASTTPFYMAMTSATSGGITELKVISSKIEIDAAAGQLKLKDSTGSTSTSTGVLVASGGVGIAENCYVGGTVNANAINETSSIMLKENISPLTDALTKISNLAGVNYTRKATGKYETGFIAEEVEKIVPEIVSNEGEYKSINYSRLTAYLVEAVKSLSEELRDLKSR